MGSSKKIPAPSRTENALCPTFLKLENHSGGFLEKDCNWRRWGAGEGTSRGLDCCGNPFRLGEEHLRRQTEVLEQDIYWTYGRVYCYWKKMHEKGPGWVRWGRSGEPLVHMVKQRILVQKRTCYFLFQKNHLSASEGALLVGLFILVCSRTVISGCYFGHRKPDGPGTRWRGRSVRTELMNHSAFPQE